MANVIVKSKLTQTIKLDLSDDKKAIIRGANEHLRGADSGILTLDGFGTTIMDEKVWAEVKARYSDMDAFKKGFIFAEKNEKSAKDHEKDKKGMRTGLEPVNTKDKKQVVTKEDKKDEE